MPKRLVTTCRVTCWGGASRVWGVMNSEKVAKRLPFRVRKTALKIDRTFNKRHNAHQCIVTLATDMWDTKER